VKAALDIPTPYTITFDPPTKTGAKRYLLRLINTSFDMTFVFSIDNHLLQVVGADFVPIHPYMNTSVLVGIGQRYHVIVEADPKSNLPYNEIAKDGNYWIRTYRATCFGSKPNSTNYMENGILRYNAASEAYPNTTAWGPNPYGNISLICSDETYKSLRPILPWTVGPAANAPPDQIGQSFTVQANKSPDIFPLAIFSMGGDDFNPLFTDYSNPTFLRLNYGGKWDPLSVVIPENYTDTDWVSA
jgi:FtsP/CotA-like multicopper oxidase with cupredoxin domain